MLIGEEIFFTPTGFTSFKKKVKLFSKNLTRTVGKFLDILMEFPAESRIKKWKRKKSQ